MVLLPGLFVGLRGGLRIEGPSISQVILLNYIVSASQLWLPRGVLSIFLLCVGSSAVLLTF